MSEKNNQVSREEIAQLNKRIAEINAIPIKDVELTENGKALEITPAERQEYSETGLTTFFLLSNIEFAPR